VCFIFSIYFIYLCMCMCVPNNIFMWIKDDIDERRNNINNNRSRHTHLYVSERLGRGRGRCSLALFHSRHMPFWWRPTSSSFIRRIHFSGGTLRYYKSWSIIGMMGDMGTGPVLIYDIIPQGRMFISSLGCLWGGRIFPSPLSYCRVL